jgi:hypothetical protein
MAFNRSVRPTTLQLGTILLRFPEKQIAISLYDSIDQKFQVDGHYFLDDSLLDDLPTMEKKKVLSYFYRMANTPSTITTTP